MIDVIVKLFCRHWWRLHYRNGDILCGKCGKILKGANTYNKDM